MPTPKASEAQNTTNDNLPEAELQNNEKVVSEAQTSSELTSIEEYRTALEKAGHSKELIDDIIEGLKSSPLYSEAQKDGEAMGDLDQILLNYIAGYHVKGLKGTIVNIGDKSAQPITLVETKQAILAWNNRRVEEAVKEAEIDARIDENRKALMVIDNYKMDTDMTNLTNALVDRHNNLEAELKQGKG